MSAVAAEVSDWGYEPSARAERLIGAAVFVVFYVPYFLIITAARSLAGGWTASLVAGVAYLIVVWLWVGSRGRHVLRHHNAIRADEEQAPRLTHLASALAEEIGVPSPSLWIIPIGGPNALACDARGPALAVSKSLLDTYSRTELEAVVAHCLVRLRPKQLRAAREAVALGPLAPRVQLVGHPQDVATVAITHYPPALANSIEKASVATGGFAPYWFVATSPLQQPPGARAQLIKDL